MKNISTFLRDKEKKPKNSKFIIDKKSLNKVEDWGGKL